MALFLVLVSVWEAIVGLPIQSPWVNTDRREKEERGRTGYGDEGEVVIYVRKATDESARSTEEQCEKKKKKIELRRREIMKFRSEAFRWDWSEADGGGRGYGRWHYANGVKV
ncbi:hypothetical protein F4811DRAFT_23632 [Daldinia bambusicola]|nr:hypothetical protein F4811DRAFT_23632 [Daldinia bambusicola]